MSGFAAVFSSEPGTDIAARASAMSRRLAHRGAVISTSGDGGQIGVETRHHARGTYSSFADVDQRRVVILDGFITNAAEVLGVDHGTEMLEAIWAKFRNAGGSFLQNLDGSFAIVIHDRGSGRFHFIRDRFAHRPLVFVALDDAVLVASETQALAGDASFLPEVDREVLPEVFRLGLVLGPATLMRGVNKALPGQVVTLQPGRPLETALYYRPQVQRARGQSLADVEGFVEQNLRDSIRRLGMNADLGLLLSGGIDSSLLAKLLVDEYPGAHGASFGASNWDEEESGAAEQVAARIGLGFTRAQVDADFDALGHLAAAIWHIGEPTRFDNAVALERTYAALAPHADTALTGEYGDTFMGEIEHRRARWLPLVWRVPNQIRNLIPDPSDPASLTRSQRIAGHLRGGSFGDYLRGSFAWAPGLVDPGLPNLSQPRLTDLEDSLDVDRISRYVLTNVLGFWYPWIERMEQTGAAQGLDVAHPFQNNAMLEYALAMKYRNKVRRFGTVTKPALRNLAARTFGEDFVRRPKKKLRAPMTLWLEASPPLRSAVLDLEDKSSMWREYVDPELADPFLTDYRANGPTRKATARAVFILLSLELWLAQHLAGERVPPS